MKRNNIIATCLEVSGLLVATVSLGIVSIPLGGCVLGAGLLLFGMAFEEGSS
jgi:hypothetical protein